MNGRCGDGGLAHGDANLRQSLDHIPRSVQARDGGHLVLVDGESAIGVMIRSESYCQVRARA